MKKVIIAAALILITGALSSQTASVKKTQPVVATQCLLTASVSKNLASAD